MIPIVIGLIKLINFTSEEFDFESQLNYVAGEWYFVKWDRYILLC